MKIAEHLSCQTPRDARFYTHKKIVYRIFKDFIVINMYQQNSQLTFTSSKLTEETVEQEAKHVQVKRKDTRAMSINCVFMSIDVVLVSFF